MADTTAVVLVSGSGPVGSGDPNTGVSTDGGTTYTPARIIDPHPLYSVIPGTRWVSDASIGSARQHTTTLFRTTFTLPEGATSGSITVCLHSDNATQLVLNGTVIGSQPQAEIVPNFQNPAECYTATGPFLTGTNTLVFVVRNFSGPMGLDYRAEVTYVHRVNAPPTLNLPADITVDATTPAGASVTFTVTADDDVPDAAPNISCTPPSGSTFAIGTTTVSCTATDDEGAQTTGTFTVTVRGADAQLNDLLQGLGGPGNSLPAKVRAAANALERGNVNAACGSLQAFLNEVEAQSGKSLTEAEAAALAAHATRIRAVIGCP